MVAAQKDMKIPSDLIPYCPVCGKPLTVNLRCDDKFVQDAGWLAACRRYEEFVKKFKSGRVVYLELGVGSNTPTIIKYPFWRLTNLNAQATYVSVNYGEAVCPSQIANQSVCINDDIGEALQAVAKLLKLDS